MTSQKNPEQDKRAARTAIHREQALPIPISGVGMLPAVIILEFFRPFIPEAVFGIDRIFLIFILIVAINIPFTMLFHKFLDTRPPESPWQYLRY